MVQGDEKKMSNDMKFLLGGLSGLAATCVVQPLDLIKTRMQVARTAGGKKEFRNTWHCMQLVMANEGGPMALYRGIGAALLRQATYTTTRLSVYIFLYNWYRETYRGEAPFAMRAMLFMTAGAFGAFASTPAEVVFIRMAADAHLPLAERRSYKNLLNGLTRIVKDEGVTTLFRGCMPTVGRVLVVNMAQLATYSQAKGMIHRNWEGMQGVRLHFMASLCSGFFITVASLPVDIVKTRLQHMRTVNGMPEYSGSFDVTRKVMQQEGVRALWKGFTPYYCRHGLHTVLVFLLWEQVNKLYVKYVLRRNGESTGM